MTDNEKERFLEALGVLGHVGAACLATGLEQHKVYRERRKDREFSHAWGRAIAPHLEAWERGETLPGAVAPGWRPSSPDEAEALRERFSRPRGGGGEASEGCGCWSADERNRMKRSFLSALARFGTVVMAHRESGVPVGRQTLFHWRRSDPEFAAAWEEALARYERDAKAGLAWRPHREIRMNGCVLTEVPEPPEDRPSLRCDDYLRCPHYEACLSAAARLNWGGWKARSA